MQKLERQELYLHALASLEHPLKTTCCRHRVLTKLAINTETVPWIKLTAFYWTLHWEVKTKFSCKDSILKPNSSDLQLNMFKPVMHEQLKSSSQSLRIFLTGYSRFWTNIVKILVRMPPGVPKMIRRTLSCNGSWKTNLDSAHSTVGSSILLTRTTRCFTPAVFANIACSLKAQNVRVKLFTIIQTILRYMVTQ